MRSSSVRTPWFHTLVRTGCAHPVAAVSAYNACTLLHPSSALSCWFPWRQVTGFFSYNAIQMVVAFHYFVDVCTDIKIRWPHADVDACMRQELHSASQISSLQGVAGMQVCWRASGADRL